MFKAIVLACLIADPSQCIEFHDHKGPVWETKEQCRERALDIARQIPDVYPDLIATQWRCAPLPKGRLI
jgi:hypothetical protein